MLVNGVDDPVDFGVASDGTMSRINGDNFEEFKGGILAHPVGAQNTETVSDTTADTLFSDGLMVTTVLQFVHTMVLGLAVGSA